ncbi:MAG: ABC transporter permease [Aminobacterium sp.]|nr:MULTISPECIES: ABC transporter permease [unclassified Aminobacterium]MDD2206879.1 ABC transporter permease [Aminobacterium sp.]MDD3425425.1 ABC transporter permease [Aminobacterium sp.]MDD3707926.1 ABC transporter permease [Aminobacterium sp.]MDD4229452.1 ABC transporter permease [Aminobacterium sp.]MDD4551000.1 ABC transporter permease [Aminobacterium sp.]
MLRYVFRRILLLIPVVLSVMVIIFTILYFTPGDPAQIALGQEATVETVAAFRAERGLDDPFFVQLGRYLYRAVFHGDLGYSYAMKSPVSMELASRIPVTMKLAFWAVAFSTLVGIPLGVICAIRQYSILDSITTLITLLGVSMPTFWSGLLFILAFSVYLGWLPSMGFDTVSQMVMPIITLSGSAVALIARITRSSMLEVIHSDYIRTARAKGQKESIVIMRHALPNAMIPILTIISMQFGMLLGGSIVTEAIFSISGVGRLMLEAINMRDYPIIQGGVLFISIAFCLVNLTADILYAFVDPRIHVK